VFPGCKGYTSCGLTNFSVVFFIYLLMIPDSALVVADGGTAKRIFLLTIVHGILR